MALRASVNLIDVLKVVMDIRTSCLKSFYPDIATCDAQWDEWKALFHIDEEQADLFTSGKSKELRFVING